MGLEQVDIIENERQIVIVPIDNRPVTYLFPQMIARVAGITPLAPPRQFMGSLTGVADFAALNQWLQDALACPAPNSTVSTNKEKQPRIFKSNPCSANTVHNKTTDKISKPDSEHGKIPLAAAICLDSLLYGGLVASRRGYESLEEVLKRAQVLSRLKRSNPQLRTVAQSAIMRIPDYDDNTEEPAYWDLYGRKLFTWSALLHKQAIGALSDGNADRSTVAGANAGATALISIESEIPEPVRSDFRTRRERNFQVQQQLLKYVQEHVIDFLIFSQDDSSRYGLNVLERDRLLSECKRRGINNVLAYAGADEVMLTLICRWLIDSSKSKSAPRVWVSFSPANGVSISSNYEGQTIGESLQKQAFAAGLVTVDDHANVGHNARTGSSTRSEDMTVDTRTGADTNTSNNGSTADLQLIVHTSGNIQGDHIHLPGHPDLRQLGTAQAVKYTLALLEQSTVPCIICDVAYSNGSDPALVEALLSRPDLLGKLYSYAGWNTTGNTIGSAVALGIARWYAVQNSSISQNDNVPSSQNTLPNGVEQTSSPSSFAPSTLAWRQALFVRLLDDWAYQTQVRKQLSSNLNYLSETRLNNLMQPYVSRVAEALNYDPASVKFSLPWNRTFEVEVSVS